MCMPNVHLDKYQKPSQIITSSYDRRVATHCDRWADLQAWHTPNRSGRYLSKMDAHVSTACFFFYSGVWCLPHLTIQSIIYDDPWISNNMRSIQCQKTWGDLIPCFQPWSLRQMYLRWIQPNTFARDATTKPWKISLQPSTWMRSSRRPTTTAASLDESQVLKALHGMKANRMPWQCTIWYITMIEGSLEVKLPTIWTDEKQSREQAERRERLKERKSEEKESEERRCRCAKK